MNIQEYIKIVKKRFKILFDKYNFSIIYSKYDKYYGDYTLILESDECKLAIFTDRRQVVISGGLKSMNIKKKPEKEHNQYEIRWSDLYLLAFFINRNSKKKEWGYQSPNFKLSEDKSIENQMKDIEKKLLPYWDAIFQYFSEENFKKREMEFNKFLHERAKRIYGSSWKE